MSWLSRLLRPKNTIDLSEVTKSLKRIGDLAEKLDEAERQIVERENELLNIVNSLDASVWAKGHDNKFIFANDACRRTILRCEPDDDITKMGDSDFEYNLFSDVCVKSDEMTKQKRGACRFIEHCVYYSHDVWLDVTKSPYFVGTQIVGIVGSGINVSKNIPPEVKEYLREPAMIEIPMDWDFDMSVLMKASV